MKLNNSQMNKKKHLPYVVDICEKKKNSFAADRN